MAVTEEEARKKACFRAATFGGSQQLAEGPGPNCIASECMAWRWLHKEVRREATDRAADNMMNECAMKTNRRVRQESRNWPSSGYDSLVIDGVGYCGLAGNP